MGLSASWVVPGDRVRACGLLDVGDWTRFRATEQRASGASRTLARSTSFGWANGWNGPTQGAITIVYEQPSWLSLMLGMQALLWIIALVALRVSPETVKRMCAKVSAMRTRRAGALAVSGTSPIATDASGEDA